MKLRFTRRSRRHLDAIAEYIAEHNPGAARRVGERIREVAALIGKFPLIGHGGVLAGTREMGVPGLPYVIVYRVDENAVTILGVYHGAQLRPGQEGR
jgi:addiction module RelE/StbE family toxin